MEYLFKIALLIGVFSHSAWADDHIVKELNAVWAEMSRTVKTGDLPGYRATFHPDAVLVKGKEKTTYSIDTAFNRWQKAFQETRQGKRTASVDFRFSSRLHNSNTAHETGMFYYITYDEAGVKEEHYMELEALVIKKSGKWQVMMEYQVSPSSKAQWERLK